MPCDLAIPAATQNELTGRDARTLVEGGVIAVFEGAKMPCTPEAVSMFEVGEFYLVLARHSMPAGLPPVRSKCSKTLRAIPGRLEQTEEWLDEIMKDIHDRCAHTADEYGLPDSYLVGANIGGFVRVADAMCALGTI